MLSKDRREICGCFGHRLPGGALGIGGSQAVIEEHSWERTRTRRLPQVGFEMEIVRIKGAVQRAEELSDDVAVAIERAL